MHHQDSLSHALRKTFYLSCGVFILGGLLSGCSWMPFFGDKEGPDVEEIETNEEKVYAQAQRSLRSSNYNSAIEQLELLEARFPFGRFAEQAQLELIYARYMTFDLEGARSGADRFIRLHPGHDNVDYAYYLKGLSAYRDSSNLLDVLFSADQATRDMAPLQEAYADFAIFLGRFPESQYAPDAQQRMVHLRNVLARSELAVADFYMRRGAYIAAGNRARFVLENYPDSEARADALATLVESNWKLNLEDEANRALRVLALNHPDYETFDDAGNFVVAERIRNRDRSWANIMSLGMLDRPEAPAPITIRAPNE
ncbi:MAG: outer membrane protein assembly factor BamD [Pseudomonadota bacterium]|nr:outer membrane protein assembly factor BamD [Pseudomonadota bacterium]MEC7613186.1 outer membrane protein assembly factor BamD [Pseudomonadota bacterium]MEC7662505.1 outer membrane protein assembly factor BamD [Pseudomonadota bacterium]MEC8059923.1 outer membrane protein assembly factor BamD [Pseudomonadota bacterium]MEE2823655.1 outer membrane protein assembly factor BamD [Pseudomonadota bacterium]